MEVFLRLALETTIAIKSSTATFLIAETGALYTCGYNYSGQLGLGDRSHRSTLQKVPLAESVKTVVAGDTSTFVLTVNGSLYVCGDNNFGQLGLGDEVIRSIFTPVTH